MLEVLEVHNLILHGAELLKSLNYNEYSDSKKRDSGDDPVATLALSAAIDRLTFDTTQFRSVHAEEARAVPQNEPVSSKFLIDGLVLYILKELLRIAFMIMVILLLGVSRSLIFVTVRRFHVNNKNVVLGGTCLAFLLLCLFIVVLVLGAVSFHGCHFKSIIFVAFLLERLFVRLPQVLFFHLVIKVLI